MKLPICRKKNLLKLKLRIYLSINPILIIACQLKLFLIPSLDNFNKVAMPIIIIFLFVSWIVVYKERYLLIMEVSLLIIFSIYHIDRVFELSNYIDYRNYDLYPCWAPIFFIYSFMVLSRTKAVIFSIIIFVLSFLVGMHSILNQGDQVNLLIQIYITHFIFVIILSYFQKKFLFIVELDTLKKIAFSDSLTNVPNRRMLEQVLEEEINLTKANKTEFSVVYLDIDHFKQINDRYGHQIGDEVLREYAAIVQKHLPKDCHFGRWGGDEFIIVANNRSTTRTIEIAGYLRAVIQKHRFHEIGNLTSSFGIASSMEDDNMRMLLWRADVALYEAKLFGGNCVKTNVACNLVN